MFGPNYHPISDLNILDEAVAHAHKAGAFTDKSLAFSGDVLNALRRLSMVLQQNQQPVAQEAPAEASADCPECPDGKKPKKK